MCVELSVCVRCVVECLALSIITHLTSAPHSPHRTHLFQVQRFWIFRVVTTLINKFLPSGGLDHRLHQLSCKMPAMSRISCILNVFVPVDKFYTIKWWSRDIQLTGQICNNTYLRIPFRSLCWAAREKTHSHVYLSWDILRALIISMGNICVLPRINAGTNAMLKFR